MSGRARVHRYPEPDACAVDVDGVGIDDMRLSEGPGDRPFVFTVPAGPDGDR